MNKYQVTLTVSIAAETPEEAVQKFKQSSAQHWVNGENVRIEEES